MGNKEDLKGGEIENEDLNNCNSIENYEKEGEMVRKSKKSSTRKATPKRKSSKGYKKAKKGLSKLRKARP